MEKHYAAKAQHDGPQRLKPQKVSPRLAAWLKPCPYKGQCNCAAARNPA